MARVYLLGGSQTDFARPFSREGKGLYEMIEAAVLGALEETKLDPADVEVAHLGNFTGELFGGQGQLGGLFASIDPAFEGIPTSRHEAACASGSVAILAALADIEAGRYDLACVVGVEQMRNVTGEEAAKFLGAAAWAGREAQGARYLWPFMFDKLAGEYEARHGLDRRHLARIAQINFENARRNPLAQTRRWTLTDEHFKEDDERNPAIEGRMRRHDCAQLTDGAAAILLASEARAARYAEQRGIPLSSLPVFEGFGHTTAPMLYEAKIERSRGGPLVFPHVRRAIVDARRRAGLPEAVSECAIDGFEVHDCFTITEYMTIDHLGITAPGESYKAIEEGVIERGGKHPVNPSGGLIGAGHPVGATGVRMALDAAKQVTGQAGDCQVEGARRFQTLNIGGSATTTVSFVIGRG